MNAEALSPLAHWQNFYVIVGSSAGALTGLQFVVIALIAEAGAARSMLEIRAFGTPTIVHFCAALLVAAILSMPWSSLTGVASCLAACGAVGIAYSLMVIHRTRRQTAYAPDAEDWLWFAGLPLAAYAALLVSALLLTSHSTRSLFAIAATTLLLLFIGIHNAWDTVTYIAVERYPTSKNKEE
jgi:hypothetical protein